METVGQPPISKSGRVVDEPDSRMSLWVRGRDFPVTLESPASAAAYTPANSRLPPRQIPSMAKSYNSKRAEGRGESGGGEGGRKGLASNSTDTSSWREILLRVRKPRPLRPKTVAKRPACVSTSRVNTVTFSSSLWKLVLQRERERKEICPS